MLVPDLRLPATGGDGRILLPDRAAGLAWNPQMARVYELTGLHAWAVLPLRASRSPHGALAVGWRRRRPFEAEEVAVLDAFAAQCAQALDRVTRLAAERRAATRTRSLAEALQRALLTDPPQPTGLQIAVRYTPAAHGAQIGGDWYDAFAGPGQLTTLVLGDVAGHDRDAAAAMAQLRNLLRGVSHAVGKPPAAILSGLDRAMADLGLGTLATTVLMQVAAPNPVADPPTRGRPASRTVTWSAAGHPPPLLLSPDGSAALLEHTPADLLLGVDPDTPGRDHTTVLPAGSSVLLYSDGLIERRGEDLDTGTARLLATAEALAHLPLEQFCDQLQHTLAPDGARGDDIALLALRLQPTPPTQPA